MQQVLLNKRFLLGIAVFGFCLVLAYFLTKGNNPPGSKSSNQAVTPQIRVGETTAQQLDALPYQTKFKLPNGAVSYTYQSDHPVIPNQVMVQNGKVVLQKYVVPFTQPTTLTELFTKYGSNYETLPGSTYYGPNSKTYFYGTQGVAIVGNIITNEAFEIQTFTPMTSATYKKLYSAFLLPVQIQDILQDK